MSTTFFATNKCGNLQENCVNIPTVSVNSIKSMESAEIYRREFRMLVHVPTEGSIFLTPATELDLDLMAEVYEIQVTKKYTQVKRRYWGEIPHVHKQPTFNLFKRKFVWMNYENEGIIEIGKQGNAIPYYVYTDPSPEPIPIKFLRGVKSVHIYRLPKIHRRSHFNAKKTSATLKNLSEDVFILLYFAIFSCLVLI